MTALVGERYLAILVRRGIDRFQHNDLFAGELVAAFRGLGLHTIVIDYREEPKNVFASLRDPKCVAFMCFNGFGSEMLAPTVMPGVLDFAFEQFSKPLFDLMHDCPAHETMGHQLGSTYPQRHLLITDYEYAEIARMLGVLSVTFVPSITFPTAMSGVMPKAGRRPMQILFAAGLSSPDLSRDRLNVATAKSRIFRAVFDEVVGACVSNWSKDPLSELRFVLLDQGVSYDPRDADHRALTSAVLDHVKFRIRRDVLSMISHLPVTLISDRDIPVSGEIRVLPAQSSFELLEAMANSLIVLCPTTHYCGFHERPLSAFAAGAAVVSLPNKALETYFVHRRDAVFARDAAELVGGLSDLVNDADWASQIANSGREKAARMLSPTRLAETVMSLARISSSH